MPPHVIISDLHLGVGDARDNFTHFNRLAELIQFLKWVEERGAKLIIAGDLFELWQNNFSQVLTYWDQPLTWAGFNSGFSFSLLDWFCSLEAVYVLGNHDVDLDYFRINKRCIGGEEPWLGHPFFQEMQWEYRFTACDRHFRVIHGHEGDPYCLDTKPGKGRISAIYSGIWEDRNKSPLRSKYRTVESATVGRMERVISFLGRLTGQPSREQRMYEALREFTPVGGTLIFGHTHRPGILYDRVGDTDSLSAWGYNCGSWAEPGCPTFVQVEEDGTTRVREWREGKPSTTYQTLLY